jgi:Protein of unknown function (DUF3987)
MTTIAKNVEQEIAYLRTLWSTRRVPSDERPSFDGFTRIQQKAVLDIEHALWNHPGDTLEDKTAIDASFSSAQPLLTEYINFQSIPLISTSMDKQLPISTGKVTKHTTVDADHTMPELPASAKMPTGLLEKVSPHLAEYIEYSKRVSPEGYKDFHLACGLWAFSTVAARRIQVPLADPVLTPLTIVMVARTSLFAKTTTAKAAIKLLKASGLGFLLGADETTPQKLLYDMAGHIPANYGEMSQDRQIAIEQRLAMAGQVGWYYDEFNQLIDAMTRQGPMAEFAGLLRKLDNGLDEYKYTTKGGGDDVITNPYLPLLASTTPANIAKHASKGASFWNDGFWARMMFLAPHPSDFHTQTMEEGIVNPPKSLTRALSQWNTRLGVPTCTIREIRDDKDKPTGKYTAEAQPLPLHNLVIGKGVRMAFDTYRTALRQLIIKNNIEDLDGSYTRLATTALRIAAILGSLEDNNHITLDTWALAQEIAEMFRSNLHQLYALVSTRQENNPVEDLVIDYLKGLQGKLTTARDMQRLARAEIRNLKRDELRKILTALIQDGIVIAISNGRRVMYSLADTKVTSLIEIPDSFTQ